MADVYYTYSNLLDPLIREANRLGKISPMQERVVPAAVFSLFRTNILLPFMAFLLSNIVVLFAYSDDESNDDTAIFFFIFIILVLTIPYLFALLFLYLSRQELSQGKIMQANGEILWRAGRYRALIREENGRIRTVRSIYGPLDLPPGNYHLFYLPRTRWLLSAESISVISPPTAFYAIIDLAGANNFHMGSLEKNRQGRLSGVQVILLWQRLLLSLLMVIVFLGIAVSLISSLLINDNDHLFLYVLLSCFLPICGAGLFGLAKLTKYWWRLFTDLRARQVLSKEGFVRKTQTGGMLKNARTFYYEIDDLKFPVVAQGYTMILTGIRYRVYYTPGSKILLNIEPVGS